MHSKIEFIGLFDALSVEFYQIINIFFFCCDLIGKHITYFLPIMSAVEIYIFIHSIYEKLT